MCWCTAIPSDTNRFFKLYCTLWHLISGTVVTINLICQLRWVDHTLIMQSLITTPWRPRMDEVECSQGHGCLNNGNFQGFFYKSPRMPKFIWMWPDKTPDHKSAANDISESSYPVMLPTGKLPPLCPLALLWPARTSSQSRKEGSGLVKSPLNYILTCWENVWFFHYGPLCLSLGLYSIT